LKIYRNRNTIKKRGIKAWIVSGFIADISFDKV